MLPQALVSASRAIWKFVPVRLCYPHFKTREEIRKAEGEPAGGGKRATLPDRLLAGLSLEPLRHGYVLLLKRKDGTQDLPPSADAMIVGRTDEKGRLVLTADLAKCEPSDKPAVVPLWVGEEYDCFWTHDFNVELFQKVIAEVQANARQALHDNAFFRFRVERPEKNVLWARMRELDGALLGRGHADRTARLAALILCDSRGKAGPTSIHGTFKGTDLMGCLTGGPNPGDFLSGADAEATYVVARSLPLEALYAAQLLLDLAGDENEKSRKHWATIKTAQEICRQGRRGECSIPTLVEMVQGAQKPRWSGWVEYYSDSARREYLEYAYKCADRNIDRKVFRKAIDPVSGEATAREIKDKTGIVGPDRQKVGPAEVVEVMAYFDFYAFARKNEHADWQGAFKHAAGAIETALEGVRVKVASLLDQRSEYQGIWWALGAHHRGDFEARMNMHTWACRLSCEVGRPFWKGLDPASDLEWAPLAKYLDWVATGADKGGDLLGHERLFGGVFNPESAEAFNALLDQSAEHFESMFAVVEQVNHRLRGKNVVVELGVDSVIEANFKTRTYVVKKVDGAGKIGKEVAIGPIQFGMRRINGRKVPRSAKGLMRLGKVKKDSTTVTAFVANLPYRVPHHWPKFMAAFGDTMGLVLCMRELDKELQENGIDALGRLGMNTLQTLSSVGEILPFLLRNTTREIPWLASAFRPEVLGAVGGALEAFFNVKDGLVLLFGGDEIMAAFEKGDEVTAYALPVKGIVLVASAVPGIVATVGAIGPWFAGTLTLTAVTGPLGIGLAIGALVLVGVDVARRLLKGPENIMEELDDQLLAARKYEFSRRAGSTEEGRGETYDGPLVGNTCAAIQALRPKIERIVAVCGRKY